MICPISKNLCEEDVQGNCYYCGRNMLEPNPPLKPFNQVKVTMKTHNASGIEINHPQQDKVCGCGVKYSEHGNGSNGYCTPKQDIKGSAGGIGEQDKAECGHDENTICPRCAMKKAINILKDINEDKAEEWEKQPAFPKPESVG